MKIKMLTPWAGDRESLVPGDVAERPDDVALEWIRAGLAVEAPEGDVAAQRVRDLSAALADVTAARDGLIAESAQAKGEAAASAKAAEGAAAEMAIHKAAAEAARADLANVRDAFESYKATYQSRVADLMTQRDEFQRQAGEAGEQLSAAQARIADLDAQLAAAAVSKGKKAAPAPDNSGATPQGNGGATQVGDIAGDAQA